MPTVATPSFPRMVCPIDGCALSDTDPHELRCQSGHAFAIRHGIPRMLRSARTYADAFGEQWIQYRTTQLDSRTGTSISRDRLRRCLGETLWDDLGRPGRIEILEAGCGAGRFTEILLGQPAVSVTSTDLSAAVEPNQENFPQSDRHRIIQCDINQLPFAPEQYDIVVCLGVIQHTRDPERTIADLYAQVKPGGWLVIDHYAPSLSHYTKLSEWLLRPVLKRLPPARGVAVTRALTRAFFPLHRAVRGVTPLQMLLSRVSPLLTYYHHFPQLDERFQYEWAELDTHDSLTDYYKHVRSRRAIRSTLASLGSVDLWVQRGGNGVEARCRKPPRRHD